MANSKTSVSNATSYEEIGEFWDNHDLAQHWDTTRAAEFEVAIEGERSYFPLETQLALQLRAAAQRHGVSPESLLNGWLQERLTQEIRA